MTKHEDINSGNLHYLHQRSASTSRSKIGVGNSINKDVKMTYAVGRPVPVDHKASAEEGIGRTDPFDHCLADRPCPPVGQDKDLELRQPEQIDSRWVAIEDESLVDRLVLALVQVGQVAHPLEWQ